MVKNLIFISNIVMLTLTLRFSIFDNLRNYFYKFNIIIIIIAILPFYDNSIFFNIIKYKRRYIFLITKLKI